MHFRRSFFILILQFITSLAHGEAPYRPDHKVSDCILAGAGLMLLSGSYFAHQMDVLSESEIARLSQNDINAFDRTAAANWSPKSGYWSDRLLMACAALPAGLLLAPEIRDDLSTIAAMYSETMLLTAGAVVLTKSLARRTRPFVCNPDPKIPLSKKLEKDARLSFYSRHSAIAFASAVFLARVYSDYYPESRFKSAVWGGSLLSASSVAYLRVAAGKHYPSDVLAGACLGGLAGYLVPGFHKRKQADGFSAVPAVSPGMTRFAISIQF